MEQHETGKMAFVTPEEVESYFHDLTEITDRVALINSNYSSDLKKAVEDLENFMKKTMESNPENLDTAVLNYFLSHLSFHREIIADIISEARQLLIEDRREYLKRLVSYHKDFVKWFQRLERRATSMR